MKERIFNLFLFVSGEDDIITEIGVAVHQLDGSDERKIAFLQRQVKADYQRCRRYLPPKHCIVVDVRTGKKMPRALTYRTLRSFVGTEHYMAFFEEVFEAVHAPQNPVIVVTVIADGKPKIEGFQDIATCAQP